MQSALRIGRVGPLTLHLNYTWLFAAVLILWWVALLWLPNNYPDRTPVFYWVSAVSVLFLFLLSVIAHELVHSAVAGSGPRVVNLFPFGAAVPFRAGQVRPGRMLAAALAGIVFNAALGFLLVFAAGAISGEGSVEAGLRATLMLLGWLNIALGLVNLIPGIPFDGGWALAGALHWFTNDPDSGLRIAQFIGGITTIALVLFGAWRGLTSDAWLQALALVVLGWASSEAGAIGRQRSLMRGMLDQLKVGDFMDNLRPNSTILATATVADMMHAHSNHPPNAPLPVVDGDNLVGVATVTDAEKLLQGTWPTTPVRSVATPLSQTRVLSPDDSITSVLTLSQPDASASGDEDDMHIPVVSGGRMVGALDPNVLSAFRDAGSQFGVDDVIASGPAVRGPFRALAALLPFLFILAAAAILGAIALRTDPDRLGEVIPPTGQEEIVLSRFNPPDSDIIGLGPREISVRASSASSIISATLSVDGTPLDAQITGDQPFTKTITAQMPGLTLGIHSARVTVSTESGARQTGTWDFRVLSGGDEIEGTPPPEVSPTVAPTPASTREPAALLDIVRYSPASGGRVLSGEDETTVSMEAVGALPPVSATLLLDGRSVETRIEPVEGSEDRHLVTASVGALEPGVHRASMKMVGAGGGFYSSDWTFTALQPGENNAYFPETGRFVSQPFLDYWQQNGGLGLFGYPISDEVTERIEGTNETYRAQYFERARLEVHGDGSSVMLGRLGALVRDPEPPTDPKPDAAFFPETGHNLGGPFRAYWEANGGLAFFGFPITEELVETNPIDGQDYTVQYFERNRFELHPDQAGTPFEVQLGLLGRQLYDQNYGGR